MPRATTRRQNAPFVQLSGDSPHAGDPLGAQVIHDGPQVRRTMLCVCLTAATACLLPTCLPLSARAPLGLPSFTPRALAAAGAAPVRIKPLIFVHVFWLAPTSRSRLATARHIHERPD